MAKIKELYQMLQTGEYYNYKEAYELAKAEGVKEYMYNSTRVNTEKVGHKVNFIEMYLKALKDDNICNNNSVHEYFVQGGNNR